MGTRVLGTHTRSISLLHFSVTSAGAHSANAAIGERPSLSLLTPKDTTLPGENSKPEGHREEGSGDMTAIPSMPQNHTALEALVRTVLFGM